MDELARISVPSAKMNQLGVPLLYEYNNVCMYIYIYIERERERERERVSLAFLGVANMCSLYRTISYECVANAHVYIYTYKYIYPILSYPILSYLSIYLFLSLSLSIYIYIYTG